MIYTTAIARRLLGMLAVVAASASITAYCQDADMIFHHGKVVTVDREFAIAQALAVAGEKIVRVGSDLEVMKTRGPKTVVIDLAGKMVLPGLIDSHTHPCDASVIEFDHTIPEMETISDVLNYVERTSAVDRSRKVGDRQTGVHHAAQRAALSEPERARRGCTREPGLIRHRP